MIILHLSWLNDRPHIWGEQPPASECDTPKRRGRKPKKPKAATFPYDSGASNLTDALSIVLKDQAIHPGSLTQIWAWLPTRAGLPIASSPLIAEPPEADTEPVPLPWQVTARPLTWDEARDLLHACIGGNLLAQGVVAGNDLLWWAEVLRVAAMCTARGLFLPGIESNGDRFTARWQPMAQPADRRRLTQLGERMPGAARCLTAQDAVNPPDESPADIMQRFVGWALDHMVREAAPASDTPTGQRGKKQRGTSDSMHDAWMHALCAEDPSIAWSDTRQLRDLATQLDTWRRPIALTAEAPVRLCFRLEEPGVGEAGTDIPIALPGADWQVRYLLQPHDDPSLLVDVSDVWKPRSRKASALRRITGEVSEYLLCALGQSAGLSPNVARTLESKHPGGYSLDTQEAFHFLTADAPALDAAGFGVILPSWWTGRNTTQHLTVRARVTSPKMVATSGIGMDAIANVDWQLALGDLPLTIEELEYLAKLKTPLVKLRGTWVELDARQLERAIYFWKKRQESTLSAGEIVRLALGAQEAGPGLPVSGIDADGWIGDLLKCLQNEAHLEPVEPSGSFKGQLRPYQERGLSWLAFLRRWGLGACLADDMGLGKTVQTLALIAREREAGDTRPVLLVCPTSVVNNWLKESERFTPDIPVMIHHGTGRRKRETFVKEAKRHGLVVSSYGLLHRDLEFLKAVPWAGVVLDEAQNIKNPETKQSRAARSFAADYRIVLTGTPVENHVGDLWALMEFLNPGLLGSQNAFKERFFTPIQRRGDEAATGLLKRLTGPFILRRLKTDKTIIADLPEKMEMKTFCTLTREQATLYAAVLNEAEKALDKSEGMQRRGLVLATLSKLKQVCNHPAHFLGDGSAIEGRSGKVARLTEMLEEILEAGERALVFTQFAEMGELLKRHLQEVFGREALFLHGGITRKQRVRMIERFQGNGDGPAVFILSLKAGGTGLNLTAANHVFHFDRWWNPSVENQATDRAFRIGQTRNVQVHKFICAGTLEDRIDAMIEEKTRLSESVVGTGEGWLTELSNDDLRQVFALGKEAVAT